MFRVQNLKNMDIVFQGKVVKAFSTQDYAVITDYIALSRLTNSGKVRYFTVATPAPVVEEKAENPAEKKVEEKKAEKKVEEPVEEKKVEAVKEEPEKEEPAEKKDTTKKTYKKKTSDK